MFESCKALSLNSHETVLEIVAKNKSCAQGLAELQKLFEEKQIPFPQLLHCELLNGQDAEIILTGPSEITAAIKKELLSSRDFTLNPTDFSTVTLTCTGATSPEVPQQVLNTMEKANLKAHKLIMSAMSATVLINASDRKQSIEALHRLI